MKSNIIVILVFASKIFFIFAEPGSTSVTCFTDSVCTDVSCGRSGSKDNWKSTGTDTKCVIADCSLLNQGNQISTNACTSCFKNQTPANLYANNAGIQCVATNCQFLTFNRKMTDDDCAVCVGEGSLVNTDQSTCTSSTLTNSLKLNYSHYLLAMLAISALIS